MSRKQAHEKLAQQYEEGDITIEQFNAEIAKLMEAERSTGQQTERETIETQNVEKMVNDSIAEAEMEIKKSRNYDIIKRQLVKAKLMKEDGNLNDPKLLEDLRIKAVSAEIDKIERNKLLADDDSVIQKEIESAFQRASTALESVGASGFFGNEEEVDEEGEPIMHDERDMSTSSTITQEYDMTDDIKNSNITEGEKVLQDLGEGKPVPDNFMQLVARDVEFLPSNRTEEAKSAWWSQNAS